MNPVEAAQYWRVELLGGLRVVGRERVIERFRTQKTAALLAFLAYYRDRAHPREVLVDLLWPDDDLEAARHKLSVALSSLRQQLEPPGIPDGSVIVADRAAVRLDPAAVGTDVAELESLTRTAQAADSDEERVRALAAAVAVYRGTLLRGHYEDWIVPEQRRLEALYFEAVRCLLPLLEREGGTAAALQVALRAVAVDPLREESHQALMRLYAASGRPDLALRQYTEMERELREQLSVLPSPESTRLAGEIREQSGASYSCPQGPSRGPAEAPAGPAKPPVSAGPPPAPEDLDPVGGAVPLDSPFYVTRVVDAELQRSIARRTSILLIKGPGQVGKTSLLARALQAARAGGSRAVYTALQLLNAGQLQSAETFLQAIARTLAEQLGHEAPLAELWLPQDGPNMNFRRFMRWLISRDQNAPLVWALDDVDRLFAYPFGTEVFALLRAWHNERVLDPAGPWSRLTLVIAYATEAHLFIQDVNQSPFNVGTRLTVEDLRPEDVADLNRRYGSPLKDPAETAAFHRLVGGHPYLVRRGLLELSAQKLRYAVLEARADRDDWVYGDHLRRIHSLLCRDAQLSEAVTALLTRAAPPDPASFYRLRSAGVLTGDCREEARPRCQLYARYLQRYLER